MMFSDTLSFAAKAIGANPFRTSLIMTAMAIGVAAVVLLTALGDSARRVVTQEFASLGSNLLVVIPGRAETTGGAPPLFGEIPRDLTLDDALALLRSHNIGRVAPVIVGAAPVSWRGREREVNILGSTADMLHVRHLDVAQGQFLPEMDPRKAVPICVIGVKIRDELFGTRRALGQWVQIGDRRFRVIGVLASEGRSIGVDFDDNVIIPVASAQALFDRPSLFRVLTEAKSSDAMQAGADDIREIIKARHDGEDDVTVITQDAVVNTFDEILQTLTLTVAGIAAISLAVAGTLIMNVMLVTVSQRTAEIGLLKAIGARSGQIRRLFVTEAALLSCLGALLGLVLGLVIAWVARQLYPALPLVPPLWSLVAALFVSLGTGLLFGVMPASRAASLDPVEALSKR